MSTVRFLRHEASEASKRARKVCTLARREAKAISATRCELVTTQELKRAKDACDHVEHEALDVRAAYLRARPVESQSTIAAKERRAERRELSRRDAIAAVRDEHNVPERVAELAVKRVERQRGIPSVKDKERWKVIASRVNTQHLAEAWTRYEREQLRDERRRQRPLDVEVRDDRHDFQD